MSDQTPAASNNRESASSSRKRPLPPALALAATPSQPSCRRLTSSSRPAQPKTSVAAAIRQRTLTHGRTPTPRPWTPVVKAEADDGTMRAARCTPAPMRFPGMHPALSDQVAAALVRVKAEPEDDRPPAVGRTEAASNGAAQAGEAGIRENETAGNVREIAADEEAPAEVAADNDAGEDVPLGDGGAGAAEDVEEGRLQFDGPLNFKYRGRRFLYVKGSKHEGRLVECEACGDRFLVGIYKENKQRKAYANDDIDGHACLYEANAEEPVAYEAKAPMTPVFEDFKIVMNPDGSVAFKDAQSLYEYNELRSKKAKHDGTGPSGSSA